MRRAYFAGGCFWCIAPVFREQNGVSDVVSGYSGGTEENPTYEAVKHGLTHHRETICITYEETVISYERLLDLFLWSVDPFDGGGQFIDRGASYTLAIYYMHQTEYEMARLRIRRLEEDTGRAAQIAIEPFLSFYAAEEYHQNFDLKNPEAFERELFLSGRKKATTLPQN